jgi:hypothetical protein
MNLLRLDEAGGGNPVNFGLINTGYTNHGTTAVAVTGEPFAYARSFNRASSQWIAHIGGPPHSTPFFIEVTVKFASLPGTNVGVDDNYGIFSDYYTGGYGFFFAILNIAGVINATVGAGTNPGGWESRNVDVTSILNTVDWFRFVVGFDGTYFYVYIDGVLIDKYAKASPGNINWITSQNMIGTFYNEGAGGYIHARDFDGQMAEFRISNQIRQPWEPVNQLNAIADPPAGFEVEAGSVAVYNFNDAGEGATVVDDTGNYDGSVVGTVNVVDAPISSKGRLCPGGSNRLTVPHDTVFTMEADHTLECWFKPTNLSSLHFIVCKTQVNQPGFGFKQDFSDGTKLAAFLYDGSNPIDAASPSGFLVTNRWYYAAAVWDVSQKLMKLYVDGVFIAEATNGSFNPAAANPYNFTVGADNTGQYGFQGTVSAVRYSNYIKTGKEIYDHYNGTNIREVG